LTLSLSLPAEGSGIIIHIVEISTKMVQKFQAFLMACLNVRVMGNYWNSIIQGAILKKMNKLNKQ
jgi:hypothetical protein